MKYPRLLARLGAVAVGIWLMAASAVLSHGPPAADVDRILGPIAASFAFIAMWDVARMVRWVTVPVGALLVVAPVLGYPADAAVNSIISGLVIIALAPIHGEPQTSFGGGWRVLWQGRQHRRP